MIERRTDLALERHEMNPEASGVTVETGKENGVTVTVARVSTPEGERESGKPMGEYITLDVGEIWKYDRETFGRVCEVLSRRLSALIPDGDGCVLVCGLGNDEITPDSLGPRTVRRLIVTRHLESADRELFDGVGFGSVAAIAAGVLGQTGIESAEIVGSVVAEIKPKCVIVIDSLASRRLSRLSTTVQLSNTGIAPGAGVSNRRPALNKDTLGVPVISLGVPTVVDAATLAFDLLEENFGGDTDALSETVERALGGKGKSMFVTPKDNDIIARETARLVASAINLALHGLTPDEQSEFLR